MFIVQEVTQGAMALHCLGREKKRRENLRLVANAAVRPSR